MHGSVNWQVHEVFKKSGINKIGTSKHAAKEIARENIDAKSRSANWHNIGKEIGVFSYKTADNYRDVWRYAMEYAKSNFAIRDIEKLTGEAVSSYLQSKIDQNVKHATFMLYASALEKLETALNMYSQKFDRGNVYNFTEVTKEVRQNARGLEKFTGSRAYNNPGKIINNLRDDNKMIAKLQLEAGLRIKETNVIKTKDLLPDNKLKVTDGKGGKIRVVALSLDLYNELKSKIEANNGKFSFNANVYYYNLEKAATAAGEVYTGKSSHGLRWNYAQNRVTEEQSNYKASYTHTMSKLSNEMGHNRADITEHYLK